MNLFPAGVLRNERADMLARLAEIHGALIMDLSAVHNFEEMLTANKTGTKCGSWVAGPRCMSRLSHELTAER